MSLRHFTGLAGNRAAGGIRLVPCLALLAACAGCVSPGGSHQATYQRLVERIGAGSDTPLYAAAAVDTPQGLWNVYIVSAPPDRTMVRQSRQDGEIEYGLTPEAVWREDLLSGETTSLGDAWRFFVRSHELFRLGNQLAEWRVDPDRVDCAAESIAADAVCLDDRFGNEVELHVGPDGLPLKIIRRPGDLFGDAPIEITPHGWTGHEGELLLTRFSQTQGDRTFEWDIQGVYPLQPGEAAITAPEM